MPRGDVNGRHAIYIQRSMHGPWLEGPCRKFGHAQGVLKRKPIHMAEFEIVPLDLENPGYGEVAPRLSSVMTTNSIIWLQ